ncbi:MAG: UDP-N-acetylmuramoyl-L-alanyl-D-glutamate--2,6-diaminopimelate ligase [Clostridiales bacterium]|nr:UDP-N-acetylmuramoyl-L-alanyl-D-glutamate--2,6-diaminopimelate ligase [Clostridiales bacterium]
MELQQLLSVASAYGASILVANEKQAQTEVAGIVYDSRKVEPGFLFVAIAGAQIDGHTYIDAAVAAGAIAIVAEQLPECLKTEVALILTQDSRRLLGRLAAAYYGHPEQELRLIGVTGTNGKTTTTYLIQFLLETAGVRTGLIGTVHYQAGQKVLPATHTTPESLELFELFALMRAEGCRAVVMEVSSHALSQGRTDCCDFSGAVFTNLTQDHLDYHGSMEAYCQAKTWLFTSLKHSSHKPAYGIVNSDDLFAGFFMEAGDAALSWTYGSSDSAVLRLIDYQIGINGSSFRLQYKGSIYQAQMPLIGKYNVYNALAALTCVLAEGLDLSECLSSLARAPQIPGRFELVKAGQNFTVAVDYAHTPDGLENVLKAARELNPKCLICVFGCGGNRDNAKRPLMGRIAAMLSDIAIITTDNPRFEDPLIIINQIEQGAKEITSGYLIEPDRAKAIQLAINKAEQGSLVIIAGKGHEDYQMIQGVKHHFDDREQARRAINNK